MMSYLVNVLSLIFSHFYGAFFTVAFLGVSWKKRNTVSFLLFSFFSLGIQCIILYFHNLTVVESCYPVVVHLPLFLLCVCVYRQSFITSISSLLMCYFLTIPRYVLAYLFPLVFPTLPNGHMLGRNIWTIPLSFLIYRYVVPSMKKLFTRSKRDIGFFVFPLVLIYVLAYLLFVFTEWIVIQPALSIQVIVSAFFALLLFYMYNYFITEDEKNKLKMSRQLMETSERSIIAQENLLKNAENELRVIRHDMRHFAHLIHEAALHGETDSVLSYTEEFSNSIDSTQLKSYCANLSVNLILSAYLKPFAAVNIPVAVSAGIPAESMIPTQDLCIILANALENAYHEVCNIKAPVVQVTINQLPDRTFIKIENSCRAGVVIRDGLPVTSEKGHGFGTRSIAGIAEKYNGLLSFTADNEMFVMQLILHDT